MRDVPFPGKDYRIKFDAHEKLMLYNQMSQLDCPFPSKILQKPRTFNMLTDSDRNDDVRTSVNSTDSTNWASANIRVPHLIQQLELDDLV